MTKTTSAHSEAVTKRIELATRLYARSYRGGEPYQVANYGIGGVYNHHTDSSGEFGRNPADGVGSDGDMVMGDRLATSMVYLTDVAAGGATAYPMLGLAVFPRRGDMVFWYNNDRNGRLDRYTFHGGCPVLVGSKWITNKWYEKKILVGKFKFDIFCFSTGSTLWTSTATSLAWLTSPPSSASSP